MNENIKFENIGELLEIGEEQELTPSQYFNIIKERKHTITDEKLSEIYENCLELLNGYVKTGQKKAMRKTLFHLDCIETEREIIKNGIDTFVYRDDIDFYINVVSKDVVKIIELENYEREIPTEIIDVIDKIKNYTDENGNRKKLFDNLFVLFTDYTGKVERQVKQERRDKDPILFGVLMNSSQRSVVDRFYFIADWEDPYCDLTFDKMVNETKNIGKRNIERRISTPEDIYELKKQIGMVKENSDANSIILNSTDTRISTSIATISAPFTMMSNEDSKIVENNKKSGFFNNIKHVFGVGK